MEIVTTDIDELLGVKIHLAILWQAKEESHTIGLVQETIVGGRQRNLSIPDTSGTNKELITRFYAYQPSTPQCLRRLGARALLIATSDHLPPLVILQRWKSQRQLSDILVG